MVQGFTFKQLSPLSGSARWRTAAASRYSSWCRIARSCCAQSTLQIYSLHNVCQSKVDYYRIFSEVMWAFKTCITSFFVSLEKMLSNQPTGFFPLKTIKQTFLSFKNTLSIKTLKFWCFFVIIVILTKASDVQDADEVGGGVEGEALVDSGHHVVKQTAVHGLCQSVPGIVGLLDFEWHSGKDTKITGLNKSEILGFIFTYRWSNREKV